MIMMQDTAPGVVTFQQLRDDLDTLQWAYTRGHWVLFDDLIFFFVNLDIFPHCMNGVWQLSYTAVLPYLDIATMNRRLELANMNLSLARDWNDKTLRKAIGREIAKHIHWLHANAFNIEYNPNQRRFVQVYGPLVARARKKR